MRIAKIVGPFLLITIWLGFVSSKTNAQEPVADVVARVKLSVVTVVSFDKDGRALMQGSGFCVAVNQIVTNKHVIRGAFSTEVKAADGKTFRVIEAVLDTDGDLALLKTESLPTSLKPLTMAKSAPRQGDKILVIGNPLGLEGSVSDGIVSGFREVPRSGKFMQITAPISPGSSGSPVVNVWGEVVGVATLNLEGGQNLNFAILSERVVSLWSGLLTTSSIQRKVDTQKSNQGCPSTLQGTAENEYQAIAILYMQKAAEYRALAYQAFNIARWQLDTDLHIRNGKRLPKAEQKKPRAIVVDVDETVLDNSPAQACNLKYRQAFVLQDWYSWGEMRRAKAIPGAVEFLNYAVSKGVKVFYVSNRDRDPQLQPTIDNLKNVGFNDVSAENVLLRVKDDKGNNISTKTPRREFVSQKYRIVMLMGDNLDDFSDVFERKTIADRFAETDKAKDSWGKYWVVLPNAMYGTWENAIYEYGRLTDAQKTEKRAAALELP